MSKGQNLYVSSHKCSNKEFREGWDRTFGKRTSPDPATKQSRSNIEITYCTIYHHNTLYAREVYTCPKCGGSTNENMYNFGRHS